MSPVYTPLGERREPHLAACAALACKHDRSLGFPCRKRCALPALRRGVWYWGLDVCLPPPPVGLGRAAQTEAGSGRQLSERSEFCRPPPESSSAGCLERSARTQTIGSPFSLLTFFLATQKESELLPGNPRPTGINEPRKLEEYTASTGSARTVRVSGHGSRIQPGMTSRKLVRHHHRHPRRQRTHQLIAHGAGRLCNLVDGQDGAGG